MPKLLAADDISNIYFGFSVSLDGDTALIGTESDSAYVFTRTGTSWTQQAKLRVFGIGGFGWSVSLDGDTALIGTLSDSAYVFTRTGTTWTQQQKLTASDGAEGDYFGYDVSINGDTALISSKSKSYVYIRTDATWSEQAILPVSGCVSLDGNTALIGGYVFICTGTTWSEQAILPVSVSSVSLHGDNVLIGDISNDDNGVDAGSAYVFTRTGTTWTQQAKLLASDGATGDGFGGSVSLDSDIALIGVQMDDDNGLNSGSAYVFTRTGTNWTQQAKLIPSDGAENDRFGNSVSVDGGTALIGSPYDSGKWAGSGSAYVYVNESQIFGMPTPANSSINNPFSLTWSILINDPEGDLFSWTIQCSNGQTNSATDATNGTKSLDLSGLAEATIYTVWVNATDLTGSGLYTRKWYTFTTIGNQPPHVNFVYTPENPITSDVISFADASYDSDGTIVSWLWDFYDGNTSTLQNTTHQYSSEGIYLVTLTVTDEDGAINSVTKPIIVTKSIVTVVYVNDDADPSWYDFIHVRTIQEGINHAPVGVTIFVYNGTYEEQINVTKSVVLKGEDNIHTIVVGGFNVSKDNAVIRNFNITGGYEWNPDETGLNGYNRAGVYASSMNNNFSHNNINNIKGGDGIYYEDEGHHGGIGIGIYLLYSDKSNITYNIFSRISGGNGDHNGGGIGAGIDIEYTDECNIFNNQFSNITGGKDGTRGLGGNGYGIYFYSSSSNNIAFNAISDIFGGNRIIIVSHGDGGSGIGIYFNSSVKNIIYMNTITNIIGGDAERFDFTSEVVLVQVFSYNPL